MPSQTLTTINTASDLWANTDLPKVCERCGLAGTCAKETTKQFPSVGSQQPSVFFLFNNPREADLAARSVFGSAPEYARFRETLAVAGWSVEEVAGLRYGHVIRCPGSAAKSYSKQCRDITLSEFLHSRPKVVVCFGKAAFQSLLPNVLPPQRGRVVTIDGPVSTECKDSAGNSVSISGLEGLPVLWVNEPWQIAEDPGEAEFWIHDFKKLKQIIAGTYKFKTDLAAEVRTGARQYQVITEPKYAIDILRFIRTLPEYSFDIEAGPGKYALDPYSKHARILCVAFSDPWRRSWCIPLWHKDSPLKNHLPEILPELKATLESSKPAAWNGKFDERFFYVKLGANILLDDDPMLMHGLLDENKGHTLKERAELDTDLGYYDEELQDCFVEYSESGKAKKSSKGERCYEEDIPFHTLCLYCCADADACQQLRMLYKEKLRNQGLLEYYRTTTMNDSRNTAFTEKVGLVIDLNHREKVRVELTAKIEDAQKKLLADPWLAKWRLMKAAEFDADKRMFLHEEILWPSYSTACNGGKPVYSIKHQAGWEPGIEQHLLKEKYLRRSDGKIVASASRSYTLDDISLNTASAQQLQEFLYDTRFLGLKVKAVTKKGGNPSADQGILKDNQKQFPVLGLILENRKLAKWKSTYLDPVCNGAYLNEKGDWKLGWIRDDGLVHPEYLMTGNDKGQEDDSTASGTVTGRKSCIRPNVQNQKKRGEGADEILGYFISRYQDQGGLIMQADFSQLELRVFAAIAGIQWMIERYANNADLHSELAMELFNSTLEQVLANGKFLRFCAKEFWFGPIYGESAQGIRDQLEKKLQLVWTLKQAEEALAKMYAKMPEYPRYRKFTEQCLNTDCSVRTPFGRRRYLPHWQSVRRDIQSRARRQAGNFIIQSTGSDMLTWAWIILNEWCVEQGIKSRIIITVHDSLVWDVYPGELEIVNAATKYAMENLPFSFIKKWPVKILSEIEVGRSWADLEEDKARNKKLEAEYGNWLSHPKVKPLVERLQTVIF